MIRQFRKYSTPLCLLVITLVAIFATEAFIMLILSLLPPLSIQVAALVNAFILTTLLFPVLYLFLFRPLLLHTTERKQQEAALRESEAELSAIYGNAPIMIVIVDREYRVRKVNRTTTKFTGYSAEEMLGLHSGEALRCLHSLDDPKGCGFGTYCKLCMVRRTVMDTFETGKSHYQVEAKLPFASREGEMAILVSTTLLRLGKDELVLASFEDITERIKMQKEQENLLSSYQEQSQIISDSNLSLEKALETVKVSEDEVQQLYQQEKELRAELQTEIEKRAEFTRALVHELKTPLVPVMSSSEMLVDGLKDEPWLSLAKNINRGATNMSLRIDELLDIAKGEVGILEVDLKAIDPLPLLLQVTDDMGAVASSREQSLIVELPPSLPLIQADEGRLRQILLNILNNASKFTPQEGKIFLRVKEGNEDLIVEVQDTGPGIAEHDQKWVFEPYYRVKNNSHSRSGLGLGLALCKKLVELHGGRIWLESRTGEGATFSFSVPLAASVQQTEDYGKGDITRILVIEDDPEIITAISLAFQVYWPEAKLISTHLGARGIQMAKSKAPDAIILDLGLPDISGLQVLNQIRQFSSVPITILTASENQGDRAVSLALGVSDYIAKPFKQIELLERLKAQVDRVRV